MGKSVFSPGGRDPFDRTSKFGDDRLRVGPKKVVAPGPSMVEVDGRYVREDEILDLPRYLYDAIKDIQEKGTWRMEGQRLFTNFAVKLCVDLSAKEQNILRQALREGWPESAVGEDLRGIYKKLIICRDIAKEVGFVMPNV